VSEEDGPKFLTAPPVAPEPEAAASPYRQPAVASTPIPRVRRDSTPPKPAPEPAPELAEEPVVQRRIRGPWMVQALDRWPRASGIVMLALGLYFAEDLEKVIENGGRYHRDTPLIMPFLILFGGFLTFAGGPSGRPPTWWKLGALGCVAASFLAAFAIEAIWL
jgi:hypothetical protein